VQSVDANPAKPKAATRPRPQPKKTMIPKGPIRLIMLELQLLHSAGLSPQNGCSQVWRGMGSVMDLASPQVHNLRHLLWALCKLSRVSRRPHQAQTSMQGYGIYMAY